MTIRVNTYAAMYLQHAQNHASESFMHRLSGEKLMQSTVCDTTYGSGHTETEYPLHFTTNADDQQ